MSEHKAEIRWRRTTDDFRYETYNREHNWKFEQGIEVQASAAPGFGGNPDYVDPEEAFVAALASCHMLTFLAIAARKRLTVDSYVDSAVGYLEKNENGKLVISRIRLRPTVEFAGDASVDSETLDTMHSKAHHNCFLANSVHTEITVE